MRLLVKKKKRCHETLVSSGSILGVTRSTYLPFVYVYWEVRRRVCMVEDQCEIMQNNYNLPTIRNLELENDNVNLSKDNS